MQQVLGGVDDLHVASVDEVGGTRRGGTRRGGTRRGGVVGAVAPKLCGRQSNEGVARNERFNSAIPDVVASV